LNKPSVKTPAAKKTAAPAKAAAPRPAAKTTAPPVVAAPTPAPGNRFTERFAPARHKTPPQNAPMEVLKSQAKADPKLAEAARGIEKWIQDELVVLFGDRTRGMRSEPTEPSLMERVTAQLDATGPITATAKRGYEIAAEGFAKLLEEMRQTIDIDLRKLQGELEAAGAPWTPGRGVPVWRKK